MKTFGYSSTDFLADGKPYRVLSGAMHYFRIPREYWTDRLEKLKACGFNTVETYVCWNLHEPTPGCYDFSGMLDLGAYIDLAAKLGLNVIIRPGPDICAEWDFGGLPPWLLESCADIRCRDEKYFAILERFLRRLFEIIVPRQITKGGNVIMLQLENEYGSYGNDSEYLRRLLGLYRDCGIDCTVFTADGACSWMLRGGTLPELLATVNFGADPEDNFNALRSFHDGQPFFCGEFYSGGFDHWFEEHHVRDGRSVADNLARILDFGGSVNIYMFHGGTNFGFMNGANYDKFYQPTITSYDYSAPLSEAGDLTPMWYDLRAEVEKRFGTLPPVTVKNTKKAAYGRLELTQEASLFAELDALSSPVSVAAPLWSEAIGQSYGYTLYSCEVTGPQEKLPLRFDEMHDRALVYIDGEYKGCFLRDRETPEISVELEKGQTIYLDILVENLGRVNYGRKLFDRKGLRGCCFGQQQLFGWEMRALEFKDLSGLSFSPVGKVSAPVFLKGNLRIDGTPCDTFIRLDGFTKGFVTVNGINLGRYWNPAGPQKTLFLPAPFLREGDNEVIVFESDGYTRPTIEFTDAPELG